MKNCILQDKPIMIKLGLFLEIVGFLLMLWYSVGKPDLKFIPSDSNRKWIADRFLGIAFGLIVSGVILQLISLNR